MTLFLFHMISQIFGLSCEVVFLVEIPISLAGMTEVCNNVHDMAIYKHQESSSECSPFPNLRYVVNACFIYDYELKYMNKKKKHCCLIPIVILYNLLRHVIFTLQLLIIICT